MLLSGEMLNMLNFLGGELEDKGGGSPGFPQNIQHIQHIQHFCRKKHILIQQAPPEFNIFNISAERSIFLRKCASFRGNVEYVEFLGGELEDKRGGVPGFPQNIQHIQHFP